MSATEEELLSSGPPADFSLKNLRKIDVPNFLKEIGLNAARFTRVSVPERGAKEEKFITRSIWLNNNKLETMKDLDQLVEALLEYPIELQWLDVSFNYITEIDASILKYPNLKILYLHGNCISTYDELFKLRELKKLRSLTLKGNPISNCPKYRQYVIGLLPQLKKLDYGLVVNYERITPPPVELVKKLKETKQQARAIKMNT